MARILHDIRVTSKLHFNVSETMALQEMHVDLEAVAEDVLKPRRKFCTTVGECGLRCLVNQSSVGPSGLEVDCTRTAEGRMGCDQPYNPLAIAEEIADRLVPIILKEA